MLIDLISKDTFQRSASHKSGVTAWNLVMGGQANYNFTAKTMFMEMQIILIINLMVMTIVYKSL